MKLRKLAPRFFQTSLLIIVVVSLTSGSFVLNGKASPAYTYYYRFTVNREGFTNVEINFYSRDASGQSWVFVPRNESTRWNYTVTRGNIIQPEVVETNQVISGDPYYFYKALKFGFQADGFFNMTLRFDFDNGALIDEPRGIFYSPQIGFQNGSDGKAEVIFPTNFQVNSKLAKVIGATRTYSWTEAQPNRVLFSLPENIVRIQIEFSIDSATPDYTTLKSSDNKTFTFKTLKRYETYAKDVLRLYDGIYSNLTRLFNVTLDSVDVQFFLPDFQTLLAVGGFVPFTGERLGEINVNVVFIRAINGTVEVIAAHELVHHFLSKTGLSPGDLLWFHEGMAQYISVTYVLDLSYEGAQQEKKNLEDGATHLIQELDGENFGSLRLQYWTPGYQPPNVDIGSLYVASYYAVSRLPQIVQRGGLDYYGSFFKLIGQLSSDFNGVKIDNINELALYLSKAANASVASTLKRWDFTVADLYNSPVQEVMEEAGRAIKEVNPVFQPYRFFAEYFYQQGLFSAERGDWEQARSRFQLSIFLANSAPWFTFLTIIALLALLVFILYRHSKRPKPIVPQPPPEIMQPTA